MYTQANALDQIKPHASTQDVDETHHGFHVSNQMLIYLGRIKLSPLMRVAVSVLLG